MSGIFERYSFAKCLCIISKIQNNVNYIDTHDRRRYNYVNQIGKTLVREEWKIGRAGDWTVDAAVDAAVDWTVDWTVDAAV